jgi:DNA-binding NarL/FixJ family response regulator
MSGPGANAGSWLAANAGAVRDQTPGGDCPEQKAAWRMMANCVIVAGRGQAMLRSLKRLLEPEFEVAAMPDNVLSMLDALGAIRPALLVVDTSGSEFGGVELARRLTERHPGVGIVLIGDQPDTESLRQALEGGVRGFVLKDCAVRDLGPAARAALAGRHFVSPEVKGVDDRASAEGEGRGADGGWS